MPLEPEVGGAGRRAGGCQIPRQAQDQAETPPSTTTYEATT